MKWNNGYIWFITSFIWFFMDVSVAITLALAAIVITIDEHRIHKLEEQR